MSKPVTFTTSGTVQAQDGIYLTRQADEELFQLCRDGQYAYILTSRQMGKSSLMVATAERLKAEGVQTAIVDLQRLGAQTTTTDKWYYGLLTELARKLRLLPELMEWWKAHTNLGEAQRLVQFLEDVVLPRIQERLVVFIDEIDSTLSLDFTDDFFIALRYCFTARAENADFEKLSFVLIGVATPSELIADQKRTPFNIGTLVELQDFTAEEAQPLAAGLGLSAVAAQQVLGWILRWTEGHPYLTQRVCEAVVQQPQSEWSETAITALIEQLFFGEKREQDNNLKFVHSMLVGRAPNQDMLGVLETYQTIRAERRPVYDEDQSILKAHLKLSGIVKRVGAALQVRNPIYCEAFDRQWIREQWPQTWWQRLKPAMPLIAGLTSGVLALGTLSVYALEQTQRAKAATERAEVEALNADIQAESLRVENLMASNLNFKAWLVALELGQQIRQDEASIAVANVFRANQFVKPGVETLSTHNRLRPELRLQATSALRKIYNYDGYLHHNTLEGHAFGVWNVSFAPDGNTIASASTDGTVKLWDKSGRQLQTLVGHAGWVTSVSFAPDGNTIASAGIDGTVKLWDKNGRQLQTLELQTLEDRLGRIESVSFAPDGQTIATASRDGTVKLWHRGGQELQTLEGHADGVTSVSFAPDGQTLATASRDGTVKLWHRGGQELQTLEGHADGVMSVSFAPDGQTLATASRDGTVKLWHRGGQELQTLEGHADEVTSVSFAPDGQTLATASRDDTIILWNLDLDDLIAKSCDWLRDYMTNPATPPEHKELCESELQELQATSSDWLAPIQRAFASSAGPSQ